MEEAKRFLDNERVDVVIHHSPCDDGHAAAAIFYHHDQSVLLHGLHPKDELLTAETRQLIAGKNVVFVDIAFSLEIMTEVASLAHKVVVLDHHVTNRTTLQMLALPNVRCVFEMDTAGCMLAWRFLYGGVMPEAFYYIGLRDVWKHESVPAALYFTTAFVRPNSWPEWMEYFNNSAAERVINQGKVIYQYQRSVLKTMLEKVEYMEWRGYRLAVVNVPFPWISDMGALMCETEPERTIAVVWNKPLKGPYSISLRTHNPSGPNVEQIALEFKGGGHVHGAGLRSEVPPWELFTEKK